MPRQLPAASGVLYLPYTGVGAMDNGDGVHGSYPRSRIQAARAAAPRMGWCMESSTMSISSIKQSFPASVSRHLHPASPGCMHRLPSPGTSIQGDVVRNARSRSRAAHRSGHPS